MKRTVISKESVRRGCASMIHGGQNGISMDAKNVSVRCQTVTGIYTMTFSREKIMAEANKAFIKVIKGRMG